MTKWKPYFLPTLVAMGLAGGFIIGGVLFQTPVHTVATDRIDTYGMATGWIDSDVEAVYFLDFLTGDLRAVTLGKQSGNWTGFFSANVAADLGVDPQKNPKYLIVTGVAYLRRAGGSRLQPSNAMCYVAEVTSGKVAAYSIAWSKSMYAAGQMQQRPLVLVGVTPFRPAMGAGPGTPGGGAGGAGEVPW